LTEWAGIVNGYGMVTVNGCILDDLRVTVRYGSDGLVTTSFLYCIAIYFILSLQHGVSGNMGAFCLDTNVMDLGSGHGVSRYDCMHD
jgi:hypothetical protein